MWTSGVVEVAGVLVVGLRDTRLGLGAKLSALRNNS